MTQEQAQEWMDNNESFRYEPPDEPPEMWSSDDYTALYDRVIDRDVQWICTECTKPFGTLERARRHVEHKHGQKLIPDKAVSQQDGDPNEV